MISPIESLMETTMGETELDVSQANGENGVSKKKKKKKKKELAEGKRF